MFEDASMVGVYACAQIHILN